ncbi:glycosyltransferase [Candidatus Dojkabacteria bacterium]|uniref:Glycosyltransferase n=1 Tax=Candidatus Dojkabacteria bacterium TaxID=2099670 RepID=A0A847VE16_9BACT|nr:glycosyltransferase [Candidatus Dojkabacteria bacterium]
MISIIITSWKEPNTIAKCIRSIAESNYSGLRGEYEILQVSPDKETLDAGKKEADSLNLSSKEYIQIKDPKKGKPYALKMAIKKAKGDILIFTDGDTYFGKQAVFHLIEPFENSNIYGVSGRPVSSDKRDSMMRYWGHLLSDSAHHRRSTVMEKVANREYYISKKDFFPMSGYIMACRKLKIDIPEDVLSDDAYISYCIRNLGKEIGYAPKAKCYVKFPQNLNDYYKQKVRSLGGFIQLKKYNVFQKDAQSRSFFIELKYSLFVLQYPKSIKEMLWSIALFPVRLITWLKIYWDRVVVKKEFKESWVRIDSTK